MSAEIINLRKARKQRERAKREAKAEENRAKHGRSRAEREQSAREAETKARHLDGHWLGEDEAGAGARAEDTRERDEP